MNLTTEKNIENIAAADTIFVGGTIYTQNTEMPWCNTVAIAQGKIIYVGNVNAGNLNTDHGEFFDLGGRFMVPGFIAMNSSRIDESLYDDITDNMEESYKETVTEITKSFLDEGYTTVFGGNSQPSVLEVYTSNLAQIELEERKKQRFYPLSEIRKISERNAKYFTEEKIQEIAIALEKRRSPENELAIRTLIAAKELSLDKHLGSIEPGKMADFVLFEEDPLKFQQKKNASLPEAAIVILNGEIVYDAEEESQMEWYNLMANQQF